MKIGDRTLASSGCAVLQPGDQQIEVAFQNLRFFISFFPEKGERNVTGEVEDGALKLKFFGATNPLGTAWNSEVGAIDGKPLFLALYFWVVGENETRHITMNYTFSIGV